MVKETGYRSAGYRIFLLLKNRNLGKVDKHILFDDQGYLKIDVLFEFCPGSGIGRHKGLKIPRLQKRDGSSPSPGTCLMYNNNIDIGISYYNVLHSY